MCSRIPRIDEPATILLVDLVKSYERAKPRKRLLGVVDVNTPDETKRTFLGFESDSIKQFWRL